MNGIFKNSKLMTDEEWMQVARETRISSGGQANPKHTPQLRLLLDDLQKENSATVSLVQELSERLTPVLARIDTMPEEPMTPRMPLPEALERLRNEIDNVRVINRILADIKTRLEV